MNRVTTSIFDLAYHVTKQTLIAEGSVWNKYALLQFSVGGKVTAKFRGSERAAIIKDFTPTHVILILESAIQRVPFAQFLGHNYSVQVCYRIEKNGLGPYTSANLESNELKNWFKADYDRTNAVMEAGGRNDRPCPSQDYLLQEFCHGVKKMRFAFASYEQLFTWFSLEEVQLFIREGFVIKPYQQGVDYHESIVSSYQVALISTPQDYNEIMQNRVKERHYF